MRLAFGWTAHSGSAALVVAGTRGGEIVVADRRRVELVEEAWAKAPYHAAERLPPESAAALVARGTESAHRIALCEMRAACERATERGDTVAACAVLVGSPMPAWSTAEILAVHFRMHKAEGALFQAALCHAARASALPLVEIPAKHLREDAERALAAGLGQARQEIAAIGKSIGPPWGSDQKDATLAALIALAELGLGFPKPRGRDRSAS